MLSSGQTNPRQTGSTGSTAASDQPASDQPAAGRRTAVDEPVMTLRGASVEVDARRVGRVVVALGLVTLAVFVVVLFVAAFQRNANITLLRQHGVPAEVTVSRCYGLMGGSGSNPVGYSCRGSFTFDGHRYDEAIPGNALHAAGSKLEAVTVAGHPGLVSTPSAVAAEQASDGVFALPTILLVLLVMAVAGLALGRRRSLGKAADAERASC
jgi:hypothetical protein